MAHVKKYKDKDIKDNILAIPYTYTMMSHIYAVHCLQLLYDGTCNSLHNNIMYVPYTYTMMSHMYAVHFLQLLYNGTCTRLHDNNL